MNHPAIWVDELTLSFELRTVASWGGMRRTIWVIWLWTGIHTRAGRFKLTRFSSAMSLGVLSSFVDIVERFLPIWIRDFTNSSWGKSRVACKNKSPFNISEYFGFLAQFLLSWYNKTYPTRTIVSQGNWIEGRFKTHATIIKSMSWGQVPQTIPW